MNPHSNNNSAGRQGSNSSKNNTRTKFVPRNNKVEMLKNGKTLSVEGVISTNSKGMGFVRVADNLPAIKSAVDGIKVGISKSATTKPEEAPEVVIEAGMLGCALHGDSVCIEVFGITSDGRHAGRVIKIISRAKTSYVGTVSKDIDGLILIADDKHMYVPIAISDEDAKKYANAGTPLDQNTKVLVELLPWNDSKRMPHGKVKRVIGPKGNNDVEQEAIILERGFESGFTDEVIKESYDISQAKNPDNSVVLERELKKRRDFRHVLTCTIDPYDAKDFDDAISFRILSDQEKAEVYSTLPHPPHSSHKDEHVYEIGVHIADVSHYVREKSKLDEEALKRGCSVYLVDRTIPMLPEELSNGTCSLNPHVNRFTFSAVFTMTPAGKVLTRWFGKTVIYSDTRFTYEKAQAVLWAAEGKEVPEFIGNVPTELTHEVQKIWTSPLQILNSVAKRLQAEKYKNGAIEFDSEEVKFVLDEKGFPIKAYKKERLDTHKLVEEFMLLANREVAKHIHDMLSHENRVSKKTANKSDSKTDNKPDASLYRIHSSPEKERLTDLSILIRALGHEFPEDAEHINARTINQMLESIKGSPEESLIKTATIRSMAKAVYSTHNIGHFGLAFDYYTHFTSPIRRYPDLIVHRILERELNGEVVTDSKEFATLENIAKHTSDQEIKAADAERASKKMKQVEYMSSRVGQTFQGVISGVTEWGLYVEEKETKSEGMIKIRDLGSNFGNDFFIYDKKNYCLVGERTKKRFRLGDEITFKVATADLEKRMLDFIPV